MSKTDRNRPVSQERLERLGAWARRKPRIALMGEFSSGKSTLLNLLIGEELLPTKVTATELPPVWFSHGAPRAYWVGKDGSRNDLDFGTFRGVPMSARYVRVFTPSPMLERCDIIDTPGISDPNLAEDSWRFAVGQANFMLWCTSATQAWRETERSTWVSLPNRLRANSMLVVTRSDKLGPGDREKVTRRLTRESFGLFGGLVFLASLDAVRGQEVLAQTGDASLWTQSGGADLDARLDAGLRAVQAERLDLLDRYVSTGPAARPAAGVTPLPAAPRAPVEQEEEISVATSALARLFGAPDPVRPRRVELPEARRAERPSAEDATDPLGAMRAGWNSLRAAEENPSEPAPVLRLAEPVRAESPRPAPRSWEPWSDDEDDQPLVAFEPASAPEAPAPQAPAAEEPTAPVAEEADSVQAVLAAMAEPEEAPAQQTGEPAAEPLPPALRIWREIVARTKEIPSNDPIVAMIDQLLSELSRNNELSDLTGQSRATIIEKNRAA